MDKSEVGIDDKSQQNRSELMAIRDSSLECKDYNEEFEHDETKDPNKDPFEKANDYVSYGYDYISGVQTDPQNVDVKLPLMDYVLQLLCNPKCTNDIFKQKMIEYQYHRDRSLDREITHIKSSLS